MDVFSLLKFWRISGGRDPPTSGDFDPSVDDEDSFFDLVLTNDYSYGASPNVFGFGDLNSSFRFSSPDEVYLKNNRSDFTFDSPKSCSSPQSPLRLLMLGFQNNNNNNRKERLENKETSSEIEEVKIGALLKRDNSLRHKLMTEKLLESDKTPSKRFSKDVVNKYLNLIKPSNVKVSKRSNDKSRLSEKCTTPSSSPAMSVSSPRKEEKKASGGGGGAMFREVRKRLGKSRSASAILQTPARKSDDSALQQDGIQGAILHCKSSYNLSRSGSAPSNNQPRISIDEQNRSSI